MCFAAKMSCTHTAGYTCSRQALPGISFYPTHWYSVQCPREISALLARPRLPAKTSPPRSAWNFVCPLRGLSNSRPHFAGQQYSFDRQDMSKGKTERHWRSVHRQGNWHWIFNKVVHVLICATSPTLHKNSKLYFSSHIYIHHSSPKTDISILDRDPVTLPF